MSAALSSAHGGTATATVFAGEQLGQLSVGVTTCKDGQERAEAAKSSRWFGSCPHPPAISRPHHARRIHAAEMPHQRLTPYSPLSRWQFPRWHIPFYHPAILSLHLLLLLPLLLGWLPFSRGTTTCPSPVTNCTASDIVQYAINVSASPAPKDPLAANISALLGAPDYAGSRCLGGGAMTSVERQEVFSLSGGNSSDHSTTQLTLTFDVSVYMRQVGIYIVSAVQPNSTDSMAAILDDGKSTVVKVTCATDRTSSCLGKTASEQPFWVVCNGTPTIGPMKMIRLKVDDTVAIDAVYMVGYSASGSLPPPQPSPPSPPPPLLP
ncbi:hypothetical protein VaNZ11_014557, partial [Volvox africanus]